MDTRPILFLDSGMGGLPYYRHFYHRNPDEFLIYIADRANFPYGPKSKDELTAALTALVSALREAFRPKLAALVCNAASVSALPVLRETFPDIPFVGTVPAVKPAALGSVSRRIGVVGTERTVAELNTPEFAARYGGCAVITLAAPKLVDWVEYRYTGAAAEERRRVVAPYVDYFRNQGADALVLGCTHFLFLLDEFTSAARPGMKVYDSMEGVSRRIEALLDEMGLRAPPPAGETGPPSAGKPANILMVTGPSWTDGVWRTRARQFGLELRSFGGPA
ncbi:MAG: glutamate racemase [Spirochaetaceae bacterium]|jgi:glutamate racemase|nr:glutamate racemase [Spirochaetaceae bacterium]